MEDISPITPTEKFLLTTWNIISAILATTGNITVLLAALKYNSVKLDKISVVLITNTAIADLGFVLTSILPSILNVIAERPVLPHSISYIFNLADEVCLCGDIYLLCAMNISKLTSLLYPLRSRSRTKKTGWMIAVSVWIFNVIISLLLPHWLCDPPPIFNYITYHTNSYYSYKCGSWYLLYFAIFILLGPFFLILITSVWLLVYAARKRSTGLQKQGVMTVILVSVNFFISNIPHSVYFVVQSTGKDMMKIPYFPQITRFVVYILNLNIMTNCMIYYLSIASFKRFVDSMFRRRTDEIIVTH